MQNPQDIAIEDFNYDLPDERIAKFPLEKRDESKLLLYRNGEISHSIFKNIPDYLNEGDLLVCNNTRVIQARLVFHKETGARIEVFCLEPIRPHDYVLTFQTTGECTWKCMVGNASKWKPGTILEKSVTVEGKEIIFGNDLTIDDIVWTGTQPTVKEKSALVGICDTLPMCELGTYLAKAKAQGREIHFLPPYRGEHQVQLLDLLGIAPAEQKAKASVQLIKAVVDMRNHKTAEEIAEIEKAVDISTRMHLAAYRMIKPGMHEAEVAAAILQIANEAEGTSLSFPTIATTHGHVLHNHGFIHTAKDGDLFLVDAGAESAEHYSGDLSSTFPVGDDFSERQKLIYNIHLDSFQAAVDTLKIGVPFRNAHIAAATRIVEGMKDLGLMKGNAADAAESGAYALFFPCGLGHMMGLDVHDMENYGQINVGYDDETRPSTQFGLGSLRCGRRLQPGFVITDEPGCYFIPALIDQWHAQGTNKDYINFDELEKWKDFGGIRIEDDILVTADGCRVLGKPIPKTVAEVEAVMAE